jgi:hypothetical protein
MVTFTPSLVTWTERKIVECAAVNKKDAQTTVSTIECSLDVA